MDGLRPPTRYALTGALLGVGAPVGLAVLRRIVRVRPRLRRTEAWTLGYMYLGLMTPLVFALFGEALGRREERVRVAREEAGRLAAMVAQDLRAPVKAMQRAIEPLLEERDGRPVLVPQATLDRMEDALVQLVGMVGELTDLARLGSGRFAVHLQPIDLRSTLSAAVAQLRGLVGDHAIDVEVAGELPPVIADRLRLEQITSLLVDDAAEHAPARAAIVVRAAPTPDGRGAEIAIDDRGPIDPVREHLLRQIVAAMRGRAEIDAGAIRVFLPTAPRA